MKTKAIAAIAAVTVVIAFPAYRYYVIGAMIANRIMADRIPYRIIRKSSKQYSRIVGG